jgi:hypothetical protein
MMQQELKSVYSLIQTSAFYYMYPSLSLNARGCPQLNTSATCYFIWYHGLNDGIQLGWGAPGSCMVQWSYKTNPCKHHKLLGISTCPALETGSTLVVSDANQCHARLLLLKI